MTKRTKRILFYSAVAIFLALSYAAILYAQGYQYSFSEGKFQRTGAISLKVNTGAKIFIDDKLEGQTSFFSNSFSIDGLLPGAYRVSVQKNDHSAWQKNIVVSEGLVTDFPRIFLLPEEGDEEQKLFDEVGALFNETEPPVLPSVSFDIFKLKNDSRINGFRVSENKNKIAWWMASELWITWLNDQNYQPVRQRGDRELITRLSKPIQNAVWFRGEDHLAVEVEERDSRNRPYSAYMVIEVDRRDGVNIVEL